jgi:hypothetical protein
MAYKPIKIFDRRKAIYKKSSFSFGQLTIKFSGGILSELQSKVHEQFETQFFDKVDKSFNEKFGVALTSASKTAIRRGGSAFERFSQDTSLYDDFHSFSGGYKNSLVKVYSEGWEEIYELYIKRYKQRYPDYTLTPPPKNKNKLTSSNIKSFKRRGSKGKRGYKSLGIVQYKERNVGKSFKYFQSQPIKHTTHGLTTGFLRRSIKEAFEGENSYAFLKTSNLFLSGSYLFDKKKITPETTSQYSQYITRASNILNKLGVYSGIGGADAKNFVALPDRSWQKIYDIMLQAWQEGPVSDIEEALRTLNMEV